MKAFIFYSLSNLFQKQITIITHWSHSNDLYLYISWWFINLFINANYLPWRSHYMASQYCVFSSDLQGNFSGKSCITLVIFIWLFSNVYYLMTLVNVNWLSQGEIILQSIWKNIMMRSHLIGFIVSWHSQ